MAVLQNVKHRVTASPSNSAPTYTAKTTESTYPHKNLHTNVHNIINYKQKMKTQMSNR